MRAYIVPYEIINMYVTKEVKVKRIECIVKIKDNTLQLVI